jgi:ribonuclease HI
MVKRKFYVVWKGRKPGIYTNWDDCKEQIGNFTGALYKSFDDRETAIKASKGKPHQFMGNGLKLKNISASQLKSVRKPNMNTISVDAACSGNPGVLEYQGVETATKKLLFHVGPFPEGTVNLGEFLALVHGLAFLQKRKLNISIYTDSITAMKWVRVKKINTKLERSKKNEKLFDLVDRGLEWLQNNSYSNKIIKWETSAWGEIPADFGRK